eukprot:GEZU01023624.1.p1 GENE.GEZU01023624.1~~GEZU01023624.1.p1  ORF type:complete len:200 (-),score=20.11 GEZU01023624.1:251-850(-)
MLRWQPCRVFYQHNRRSIRNYNNNRKNSKKAKKNSGKRLEGTDLVVVRLAGAGTAATTTSTTATGTTTFANNNNSSNIRRKRGGSGAGSWHDDKRRKVRGKVHMHTNDITTTNSVASATPAPNSNNAATGADSSAPPRSLFLNSKPCLYCCEALQRCGIYRVIFSTGEPGENEFRVAKVACLQVDHLSRGQRSTPSLCS